MIQHSYIKTDDISAGYVAYNGYIFSVGDANAYNVYNDEIARAIKLRDDALLKTLLDRCAHYFKLVINEM